MTITITYWDSDDLHETREGFGGFKEAQSSLHSLLLLGKDAPLIPAFVKVDDPEVGFQEEVQVDSAYGAEMALSKLQMKRVKGGKIAKSSFKK